MPDTVPCAGDPVGNYRVPASWCLGEGVGGSPMDRVRDAR